MTKEDRRIDVVAEAIYNANWGPIGIEKDRYPPVWRNVTDEVRNFVTRQAKAAIDAIERNRSTADGSEP